MSLIVEDISETSTIPALHSALSVSVRERDKTTTSFHEMTRRGADDHLHSLYHAQPKADWATLAVGNIIVNKGWGLADHQHPAQAGLRHGDERDDGRGRQAAAFALRHRPTFS